MLLGVILLVCGVGQGLSYGAPLHSQFPLGTVGCLFMEHLCQVEEECVDDLLFGNCQRVDRIQRKPFQYQLSQKSIGSLRDQIYSLIKGGYSWHDQLAQCIIQNALYAFRKHKTFHPSKCQKDEASWTEQQDYDVKSEISAALEKLFQDYYNAYEPQGDSLLLSKNADKRDEIIKVHKYFDKDPQPYLKREFSNEDRENYLNYLSGTGELEPSIYEADKRDSYGLSPEDIQQLQYYLQQLRADAQDFPDNQVYSDLNQAVPNDGDAQVSGYYQDALPVDNEVYSADQYNSETPQDWEESQPTWDQTGSETKGDNPYEWSSTDKTPAAVNDEPALMTESDPDIGLPDKYADLLSKLMMGQIRPENLTDDELNYLTEYVNLRLTQLGYSPDQIKKIGTGKDPTGAVESAIPQDLPETEFSKENLNENSEQDAEKIMAAMESEMGVVPSGDKGVLGVPVVGSLMTEDKKSVDEPKPVTEPAPQKSAEDPNVEDIVNTDYAFVEFTQHLDRDTASGFLSALEHMLNSPVPFDPAEDYENRVTFYVNEKLTHMNASTVAQLVEERKSDLETLTGVKIVRAGIGYRNQVEVKPPDDRYFVLTFVLCGCIAGILLAVVVIYLIRRYSKSKEKLAQLSANGDNTEASKDYQDLCRQRMQGKSSEKPEPLHAASRIGSVSESQVRSPSSRSSTSSWSEEPVSSNMDISTGHIVLSYMEDHLKNNDRLDREWEGLGAYEADPNSTKVASDPSNLRKNRYSDVLPYDHSRVILSNTSNVSGSDYINASSITDHDPRNPAYIATQGPLPHTIADFWQMVWEQGSVVIVMLSKMTENGESMCHRYWPEEGSDLYHIYEVHLVSEHIWCDDYLVRSFYLKNLQTNETRTVTMFHYLTWPDLGVPSSIKSLLDFRRKVNKSYRGRSCPIVVHCSDGCGRTGTYCLLDMVLNRMAKGAKEIDIAASLEHIRDQRMCTVKTKEQFQFALAAVAEEVHAILKALPQ
ncbi:receptor-type tyrosine-protein phosphatase N2-like [Mizuhopecten yessoensis]|uniref:Receptor-type tyrosine-protein phosphatase N2 n=1 Tax=Mizuhopecten yessoensis TaxID=6573 RepID=A0A210QU49_MIZYE|nr:receptor-type tyrosine-protein phosphatase N2-like [Mizuhopecten yessoensis]OWF52222.1 Receptor-type tyrosine-protein phosphatase N2 [Mizuhopecten yessoensis]